MYIDIVPNRKSRPAVLLRECYRENGTVKKRTIANLSAVPMHIVTALRDMLKGGQWVPFGKAVAIERSLPHGAVRARKARAAAEPQAVHNLNTLFEELNTLCRNTCRVSVQRETICYTVDTEPTAWQAAVLAKLEGEARTQ